jgi:hypothetical protein
MPEIQKSKDSKYRPYIKRLAIIFAACFVLALVFNEVAYRIQKDSNDRAPQLVQIVITAGTAARVAAGEPVPSIPPGVSFVEGDVLEVINQDSVNHQLGPLWIPAGASASLAMDNPERLSYSCSFQTSKFLDILVRPATTFGDRIAGLSISAPTLAALVFVYSLAALPLDGREKKKKDAQSAGTNG